MTLALINNVAGTSPYGTVCFKVFFSKGLQNAAQGYIKLSTDICSSVNNRNSRQ